ncbi:MAG TPA: arsenate reductase ArsC [Chloroflexota bacterium]|nr:arsenate reductase ArsC [Chloroflexota bacterium]
MTKLVLFVCVHNSGRSQMAEAFFNRLTDGRAISGSAGTEPTDGLNPTVVEAMGEIGIDLTGARPKLLTQHMLDRADRVITMGCSVEESCPALFLPQVEDWGLEDPAGKPMEKVRQIRDEIAVRVKGLLAEL